MTTTEITRRSVRKGMLRPKPWRESSASKNVKYLLHWALVVYAFLLPLEIIELGPATRGSLSLPKIEAVVLLALAVLCRKLAFRTFEWPHRLFACYLMAFFFSLANVSPGREGQVISLLITLVQLFVVFWLTSNLLRDGALARRVILAFSIGCSVVGICGVFNIGGMATMSEAKGVTRLSFGDYDPNEVAFFMATGTVILIGMFLEKSQHSSLGRVVLIGLACPQVFMLILSGSRTGLAAVVVGIGLFVIFLNKRQNKALAVTGGIVILCGVVYLALTNPAIATRLQDTVDEGHTSGRGLIFAKAVEMFLEKPLWGWGPVESQFELGRRTGRGICSPHNLYLRVLLQVGFLGGGIFLVGLALCVWCAWHGRGSPLGNIPFVLMSVILISNLSLDYLTRKLTWFVLAIAVAAPYIKGQLGFLLAHGQRQGAFKNNWVCGKMKRINTLKKISAHGFSPRGSGI